MGSDENSRRQDNKDKGGFLVIESCAVLCVSTPSRTLDTIVSMPTMNVNRVHDL